MAVTWDDVSVLDEQAPADPWAAFPLDDKATAAPEKPQQRYDEDYYTNSATDQDVAKLPADVRQRVSERRSQITPEMRKQRQFQQEVDTIRRDYERNPERVQINRDRKKLEGRMPFVGSVLSAADTLKVTESARRFQKGEHTQEDVSRLAQFQVESESLSAEEKAKPWFKKVQSALADMIPYAVEFAATGGAYAAGRAGATAVVGGAAKGLAGRIAQAAIPRVAGVAAQSLANPARIVQNTAQQQLSSVLSGEDQTFLQALPAGVIDTVAEIGSERAGGLIGRMAGKLVPAQLKSAITEAWIARTGKTARDAAALVASKTGWNGLIGELGEERTGEVIRGVFGKLGVGDFDFGTTGKIVSGDPQGLYDLSVEAGAMAVPGLASGGAQLAERRLTQQRQAVEELKNASVKGFVSEVDGRKLGLTPEEMQSRKTRYDAVRRKEAEARQELERTEKEVQNAQEVQPEGNQVRPEPPAAEVAPEAEVQSVAEPTREELPDAMARFEAEFDSVPNEPAPVQDKSIPPTDKSPATVTPESQKAFDRLRSQSPETDPPIPEGMTRLYHGSAERGRYDGPAWYSTDRTYARDYRGKDAELQYVDVPTEWAMQKLDPDGYGTPASTLEIKGDEFGPRKPLAPAKESPPVDEARVQELLKQRGKFGNKRAEETARKDVAEEAELLRKYPPGTKLGIAGFQETFEVKPNGKLMASSGRWMGDNAGAVLRFYKPNEITVLSQPEAGGDNVTPPAAQLQPNPPPPIPPEGLPLSPREQAQRKQSPAEPFRMPADEVPAAKEVAAIRKENKRRGKRDQPDAVSAPQPPTTPPEASQQENLRGLLDQGDTQGSVQAQGNQAKKKPSTEAPERERVVSAAVRINGQLFKAPTHIQAMRKAHEAGLISEDFVEFRAYMPDGLEGDELDLFVTDQGRVITEDEAHRLTGERTAEDIYAKQGSKPPTTPPEAVPAKEPWQMTREEVVEQEKQFGDILRVTDKGVVWSDGKFTPFNDKRGNSKVQFLFIHERAIQKAISEGKPVPPEVLKDYPDLKPPATPQNASEAKEAPEAVPTPETLPEAVQEPGTGKEPWQMTRDEWVEGEMDKAQNDPDHPEYKSMKSWSSVPGGFSKWQTSLRGKLENEWYDQREQAAVAGKPVKEKPSWMLTQKQEMEQIGNGAQEHRMDVEAAIKAGKPVPPEVLADYPDLVPKQPKSKGRKPKAPETPQTPETVPEPWQMTAWDYATQHSRRMTELEKSKPRPLKKMYGARGPTPEQAAAHAAEMKDWNRQYRQASKSHKEFLADQGIHARLVQQAVAAGKPVPAEVLEDYPDLASREAATDRTETDIISESRRKSLRTNETSPGETDTYRKPGSDTASETPQIATEAVPEAAAKPAQATGEITLSESGAYDLSGVDDATLRRLARKHKRPSYSTADDIGTTAREEIGRRGISDYTKGPEGVGEAEYKAWQQAKEELDAAERAVSHEHTVLNSLEQSLFHQEATKRKIPHGRGQYGFSAAKQYVKAVQDADAAMKNRPERAEQREKIKQAEQTAKDLKDTPKRAEDEYYRVAGQGFPKIQPGVRYALEGRGISVTVHEFDPQRGKYRITHTGSREDYVAPQPLLDNYASQEELDAMNRADDSFREAKRQKDAKAAEVAAEAKRETDRVAKLAERASRKEKAANDRYFRQAKERAKSLDGKTEKKPLSKSGDPQGTITTIGKWTIDEAKETSNKEGRFAVIHAPSGVTAARAGSLNDAKLLIQMLRDAEIEVPNDPKITPPAVQQRFNDLVDVWDKGLLGDTEVGKHLAGMVEVPDAGVSGDIVLDASDLILPGGTEIHGRLSNLIGELPEFAYNPVFTVNDGRQLVFQDGYKFTFNPSLVGLDDSLVEPGQTVALNLRDVGIERPEPETVVKAVLGREFAVKKGAKKQGGLLLTRFGSKTGDRIVVSGGGHNWNVTSGTGGVDAQRAQKLLDGIPWTRKEQIAKNEAAAESVPKTKLQQAAEAASADAKSELDELGKAIRKKGLPSNPFLDPDLVARSARVVYKFAKAGGLKFAVLVEKMTASIGQKHAQAMEPVMRAEWNKLQATGEFPDMEPAEGPDRATTGTKNAKTDELREKLGMGERPPVQRESFEQWEREAAKRIKDDPDYAPRLVAELTETPRPIDKTENAAIGQYIQALENRRKAGEDVSEELVNAVQADDLGGTETARALGSRRTERYADFSLAGLVSRHLDSVKEKPTKAVMKSLAEQADRLTELEAQLADKIQKLAQAEVDLQIAQAKAARGTVPPPAKLGTKRQALQQKAADAVANFKEKWSALRQMGAVADPQREGDKLFDVTAAAFDVVTAYSELGVNSFLEFLSRLKGDFGTITNDQRDAFREAWSKRDKSETADRDPATVGELARKMTRWAVEAGITEVDAVVDAVHADLTDMGFEISRTDAMEAISGYGSYRPLTRSEAGIKAGNIKREIRRQLADRPENQTAEEAKRAARYQKTLERSLAMWEQRRIDAGQGILPQKRKPPPANKEILDTKMEIEAVQYRALALIEEARRAKYNLGQWIGAGLNEVTSTLPRNLMAGLEGSVVLRQGPFYTYSHPFLALMNFARSMGAAFSQRIALASMENIKTRVNYPEYGPGGVEFTHHEGPVKDWEEMYSSSILRWLEGTEGKLWLPLRTLAKAYMMSERGFSNFRNTMAADMYDILKRDTVAVRDFFSEHGMKPRPWGEEDGKTAGRSASALGGRATGLKPGGGFLNWFLFARRFIWANIQREFIIPFQMATPQFIGQWNADAAMRIAHAKLYAQFLVGAATHITALFWLLTVLADDEDEKPTLEFDPRSTDLLKPKIGETRIDVLGGMQQPIVLLARIFKGESKGPDGKITKLYSDGATSVRRDTSDVLIQWGRGKLGPGPSGILDWFARQNLLKQPKSRTDVITERIQPMTYRELWEAEKELGLKRGTITFLEGFIGAGVNTYGPRTNYRNASEAERLEIVEKDLKGLRWDDPPEPAYAEFLTEEQLTKYRETLEERKQSLVVRATVDAKTEDSVAERDKAAETLRQETGWTRAEAIQLLRKHYAADRKITPQEKKGLNERIRKLNAIYGD